MADDHRREIRRLDQWLRRDKRRAGRIKEISKRRCLVCLEELVLGDRTTKRYCSDACRQAAHRLRAAGKWPRQMKLYALHERCHERLFLGMNHERLLGSFNELCHITKLLGSWPPGAGDKNEVIAQLLRAQKEHKREDVTVRTLIRCKPAARKLRQDHHRRP